MSCLHTQEPHDDPNYLGYYDAAAACPPYAKDWDCMLDGDSNREKLPDTYKKVCQLTGVVPACRFNAHQATVDKPLGETASNNRQRMKGGGCVSSSGVQAV